jgi:acyl-CoA synthetase (AMP-forming)/AMP-acid ligase II
MDSPDQAPLHRLDLTTLSRAPGEACAVHRSGDDCVGYGRLRGLVARGRAVMGWPRKALVAVTAPRTLPGLLGYLAALAAGHAAFLAEETAPDSLAAFLAAYQPDLVISPAAGGTARTLATAGYRVTADDPIPVWQATRPDTRTRLHPELGLLMRTSGSLGTPKMVRLSFGNLHANARSIVTALGIRATDRCLTALPLDYSFGLSLVNSHLAAGASVTPTTFSPSSELFWRQSDDVGATCFGAVPSTYRFLRETGWGLCAHRSVRLLLQAGGPLDGATLSHFRTLASQDGREFICMYGQTEATARIAYLPAALAAAHQGSVGRPVPGGTIRIERPGGAEAADGEIGEIVYSGPNVMMGYARSRADLGAGQRLGGTLRTGDLGCLRQGMLYITGRADRQVKVLGRRIDLEQVERILQERGITAAAEAVTDQRLVIATRLTTETVEAACRSLARSLNLPSSAVRPAQVADIPRTQRGKVDHATLIRDLGRRPA